MIESKKFNSFKEIENTIHTPSIQRDIVSEHVSAMRSHIAARRERGKEPIFGAIDIVELHDILYVVDGQHRLEAIRLEWQSLKPPIAFHCLIYHVESQEELREIFVTRNKGIALPQFLLDDNGDKTDLLKQIHMAISARKGFDQKRLVRPYLHINHFMDALASSKIFQVHVTNAEQFIQILEKLSDFNKCLSENAQYRKENLITVPMLKKCKEWNNYLGLNKNMPWFDADFDVLPFLEKEISMDNNDEVVTSPQFHSEEEKRPPVNTTKRKQFSNHERVEIWSASFGTDARHAKCPYCHINSIAMNCFHVGHVVSLHNHGSNEISNVRPICQSCNAEIGRNDMNLQRYNVI